LVCIGWGKLLLLLVREKELRDWDVLLLAGVGVWGCICFLLLWIGLWQPWLLIGIFLGGLGGWWLSPQIRWPRLQETCALAMFGVACMGFLDAWGPIIDTDSLYYHQALAKQMAIRGELIGGWFEPNGSRPMLLHSVYAFVWQFWGEKGPSVLHLCMSLGLLVSVVERSRSGFWGLLLLVSSWSLFQEIGIISNNLPTAFAIFLTWRLVCAERYRMAAWLAFVALSYKLTSVGLIFAIWLLYIPSWRLRSQLLIAVVALFSIWPLRNIMMDVAPMFPFMGWEEPFQSLDKYGMGRSLKGFLWLPWNIFQHAEIDSHQFQGQLSWMLMVSGLAWIRLRKKELFLLAMGCAFWALGPQWLRHFTLLLPLMVFLIGPQLRLRWFQGLLFLGFLYSISNNWGPLFSRWSAKWEVIRGEQNEEVFLSENIVGYDALQWVNTKIPKDSCPALLFVWGGAVLDRPYLLSSVEDHIPVRAWIKTHKERSFSVLPCDYVVVGKAAMSRKRYSFLSDEQYQHQIERPLAELETLLLKKAVLVYTEKGIRVYRIQK